MNTSEFAYTSLIDSGKITNQQESILQCFAANQVLSTYEIQQDTEIDRVNTVGARCSELTNLGVLIGVGRKKHGNYFYSTFRLARNAGEVARFLLSKPPQSA